MVEVKKLIASTLLLATSASTSHTSTTSVFSGFDITDDGADSTMKSETLLPINIPITYDVTSANGKASKIDTHTSQVLKRNQLGVSITTADWVAPVEHQGTITSSSKDLSSLISAVRLDDHATFISAFWLIDWNQKSEEEFIKGISLALQMDAIPIARHLVQLGLLQFPGSSKIDSMNTVLSPPKAITQINPLRRINVRANNLWIKDNSANFGGQYVALRNGQLLASGTSMRSVIEHLTNIDTDDVLFTRVI